MRAFILAGGFATRLWPLTEARAKPLLPLAGKPIINYLIEGLPSDMPVAVSTNAAFATDFAEWKQQYGFSNVEIIVEHTESDDAKLGALGALAQWIDETGAGEDVLVLTGDNYFALPLKECLNKFSGTALVAAYDVGSLDEASRYGTVLINKGAGQVHQVTGFEEKPREPKTSLVSTGACVIPQSALHIVQSHAKKHPDDLGGVFEAMMEQNEPVECFAFTEPWYDIGSFWAYIEAVQTLVGTSVQAHDSAELQATITAESVVLGANVRVRDSKLENVVVFDDCVIENCVLRNCIVDTNCVLKNVDLEGKMIRSNTRLINEVVELPKI